MKLKNVSFFERHVEKFVLLATALVLLAVVYFFWMGEPNAVEISNRRVAPGEVDEVIYEQAQQLRQQVRSEELPQGLANLTVPRYTQHFSAQLGEQPLRNDFAIAFNNQPWMPGLGPVGTGEPYHVPQVPEPTIIASQSDLGTIDPLDMQAFPQLAGYFGETAPHDGAWVSLVGQFDLQAMLEELQTPGGEQTQQLPERWWDRTFAIVDVQVERQRMRPDGSWPEYGDPDYEQLTSMVQPIPGQVDFNVPEKVTPRQASQYLMLAQQFQMNIIQPGFYTLMGAPWIAPSPETEEGGQSGEVRQVVALADDIKTKRKQIRALERQIQKYQERSQRRSGAGSGMAGGYGAGGMEPGMDAGGMGGPGLGAGGMGGPGMGAGGMGGPGGGPGMSRGMRGGRGGTAQRGGRQQLQRRSGNQSSGNAGQRRIEQYQQRIARIEQMLQEDLAEYQQLTGGRTVPTEVDDVGSRGRAADPAMAAMDPYGMGMGMMGGPGGGMGPGMMGRGMGPGGYGGMTSEQGMEAQGAADEEQRAEMMRQRETEMRRMMQMRMGGAMLGGPRMGGYGSYGQQGQRQGSESRLVRPTMDQQQLPAQQEPQGRQALGSLLLDPPQVDLQVNDIDVEPGATYRYRMRVGVVNPLFNKRSLPEEQQAQYGEKFLLYSGWSDWSTPIPVEKMEHFFVLGASSTPSPGSANVEVWRYYDGQWRNEEFRVQPGDPVGEPQTVEVGYEQMTIDYSTDNFLVDLDTDFTIPGSTGNAPSETTRVLFMKDGDMVARRLDQERNSDKREWLRNQQEYSSLMGL